MSDYYVYQLIRPWNGIPCYIGKGRGKRAKCHAVLGVNHYNDHLASIYRKAGAAPVPVEYIATGLTEDEALALEVTLIAELGRADLKRGPLANWTDGGERSPAMSDQARAKIVAANNQRWQVMREAGLAAPIPFRQRPKLKRDPYGPGKLRSFRRNKAP